MTTEPATQRNVLWKVLLPMGVILTLVVGGLYYVKSRGIPNLAAGPPGSPETGEAHAADIRVGATLPDFSIQKFGGGPLKASALKGKVVMINFWATWCEACMVEMPSIVELYKGYKDRGFEIVSVNVDENPEKVLPRTLSQFRMDFDVYTDAESKLAEIFDVHAIPLTIIMDKNRKILFIENGERDWNGEDFRTELNQWLSG